MSGPPAEDLVKQWERSGGFYYSVYVNVLLLYRMVHLQWNAFVKLEVQTERIGP